MSNSTETKLLLAIISSAEVTSIPWETVGAALSCNKKAAAERFRKFKLKLPLPAGHTATDAEAQLLLAIFGSAQVSGINWEAVGKELGCNKKAAAERFRKFKLKNEKKNSGEGEDEGKTKDRVAIKKGKVAAKGAKGVKADGGGVKKSVKRKAEDDGEEDVATEGGPVGGINASPKKRARVQDGSKEEDASVKGQGEANEEDTIVVEGERPEHKDEFFEAEDGVASEGSGIEVEGSDHEI